MSRGFRSSQKKQKGILTLDFLFSFMATYTIAMVFGMLSLSLMMIEVSQYISFSMARAHISGDTDIELQRLAASDQYETLVAKYKPFIKVSSQGWFKIQALNDGPALMQDFSWSGEGGNVQRSYGVGIKLTANILKKAKFPFLGSPGDGSSGDFGETTVYSFLYREPTTEECLNFNRSRWKAIESRFSRLNSEFSIDGDQFGEMADNGC